MRRRPKRRLVLCNNASAWPAGVARVVLAEVDSTMTEAARRAPPPAPTWIMARHQTSARGRRGRAWRHPSGNFAATLLMVPERPPREVALYSFVAAVSVSEALRGWVAPTDIALKWPNDVLLRGRKVAGILLESAGTAERVIWLAVGIGVNLETAPEMSELDAGATPPIALADVVTPWPPAPKAGDAAEMVLTRIAAAFARYSAVWEAHGFEAVRSAWLDQAVHVGKPIEVRLPGETLSGTFRDVDQEGCLVLDTGSGARRVAAGEVFLR